MQSLSSFVSTLVLGASLLTACAQPAPTSDRGAASAAPAAPSSPAPSAAAATTPKSFGSPITETQATTLDAIAQEPAKYLDKTVRTEGVVTSVCQEMGCWVEIGDQGNGKAHIKMAGHSFFIPKNAAGHHAVVQAKVLESSPAGGGACMHEGKDSCAAPDGASKLQLEASGVELID